MLLSDTLAPKQDMFATERHFAKAQYLNGCGRLPPCYLILPQPGNDTFTTERHVAKTRYLNDLKLTSYGYLMLPPPTKAFSPRRKKLKLKSDESQRCASPPSA